MVMHVSQRQTIDQVPAKLKTPTPAHSKTPVLPKMSPLNPLYLTKKQTVFQKVAAFVEKFKGVGGAIG